jgi:exosortase O
MFFQREHRARSHGARRHRRPLPQQQPRWPPGASSKAPHDVDRREEWAGVVSSHLTMAPDGRWRRKAIAAIVVAAAPLMPWCLQRASSVESFTGFLLMVVGCGLVASGQQRGVPAPKATAALALAGVLVVVAGWWVEVRLLYAAGLAAVAAAVVAIGDTTRAPPWAALCLVWLGLPLAGDIDVVGFPLRVMSAELAATILPALGVPVVFAETVLLTEHGLTDVESACAGLTTLRILLATVAVIAALRGARLRALILALAIGVVVAVLGNATRVTILSWLVLGARRPELAELVHVALGILVFVSSIGVVVPVLAPTPQRARATDPRDVRTAWAIVIASALALGAMAACRMVARALDDEEPVVVAPRPLLPDHGDDNRALSPAEAALFSRHALAARTHALRDRAGRLVGEALVVVTIDLRSIHAPERCLAAHGHVIVHSDVVERAHQPVKRMVLDHGNAVGLSFIRSARHHEVDLRGVRLARLGLLERERDEGPWVFVSAVLEATSLTIDDEDDVIRQLLGDVDAALSLAPRVVP